MATADPANPQLHLSKQGYAELLRTEANLPFIYDDLRTGAARPLNTYEEARGTPTMGIGVAIQGEAARQQYAKYLGKQIPAAELEEINRLKLAEFEANLNKKLVGAKLSQAMYDALFSLMWNTGPNSSWVKNATNAVKAGDYAAAQQTIANGPVTSKGQLVSGLVTRRAREAAMFASEGLTDFVSMTRSAADVATRNPIPFVLAALTVSGTTFFLVRRLSR
jgi:GH24 family phage-related lysozyme (muramidase)